MAPIRVVFFDLGDTLVEADPDERGRFRWLEGALETLAELRESGLGIGLISNTGDLGRNALRALMPEGFDWDLFDGELIILSSETEATAGESLEKPDLRIFRLALSRAATFAAAGESLTVDRENCLFCGEDLVETLVAQRVGFRVARVQRPPQTNLAGLRKSLVEAGLLTEQPEP